MADRFLTEKEVRAAVGGCARSTLQRWEKSGLMPSRRRVGICRVGWLQSEVDEWIASRPRTNSGDAGRAA